MSLRSINRVFLLGRVGKDPEITHIPNLGKDVAKFSLATDEGYMDRNNQWQDRTEWHNIVAWGGVVKIIDKSVKKGDLLAIEGKIKTNKWQDRDGNNRYTTEISLDNITLIEKTGGGGGTYTSNTNQQSNNYGQSNNPNTNNQNIQNNYQTQAPPSVDINSDIDYSPENSGGGDPF